MKFVFRRLAMIHFIKKSAIVILLVLVISFGIRIPSTYAQSFSEYTAPNKLVEIEEWSSPISAYAFSPDGSLLVIGDGVGSVEVRNTTNGELIRRFAGNYFFNLLGPHSAKVTALSISSDGKTLISGSSDKTVKIWDLHTGVLLHDITDFQNPLVSLAFRQGDKEFVTEEASQIFKIWSADRGSLTQSVSRPASDSPLNLSSDGEWVWSVSDGIKFWHIDDTTQVHHQVEESSGHNYFSDSSWHKNPSGLTSFNDVAFSPISNQVSAIGKCAYLRRDCVNVFDIEKNVWYDDNQPSRILHAIALSPDSHRLATNGYYAWTDMGSRIANEIIIRDFKLRQTVAQYEFSDKSPLIREIAFSPNSKRLLTVDENGNAKMWTIPN